MKVLKRVSVSKGEAVFRQGDESDSMYFVESGRLDVELELEGGKLLRLKKVGPGAVLVKWVFIHLLRVPLPYAPLKSAFLCDDHGKTDAIEKRAPCLLRRSIVILSICCRNDWVMPTSRCAISCCDSYCVPSLRSLWTYSRSASSQSRGALRLFL